MNEIAWLPGILRRRGAALVIAYEFSLVLALLAWSGGAAVAALVTLIVFSGVIVVQSRAGNQFDCGCFGGPAPATDARLPLMRNALAAAAAVAIIASADSAGAAPAVIGVSAAALIVLLEAALPVVRLLAEERNRRRESLGALAA